MLNPKSFKAYDIRGIYPKDIDEDGAFLVGQAAVRFTKSKALVVGKDMRSSTPSLFDAFARGAMSQGADVIDIGMVTTPMFYFGVGDYELHDAGVMVTASHNPKEYNGFKLCFGDVLPIGADSGIFDVRDLALKGPYPAEAEGIVVETDIREAYLDKLLAQIDVGRLRKLEVAVDCGNGMEGVIIRDIFSRLPSCEMRGLYLEPDGTFPNHEANPIKEETLYDLKVEMKRLGADIGIAFDGDGDRVGVVDELGRTVRGDIITALLAPRLLRRAPGAAVLHPVNMSWTVQEEVTKAGGRPVMCRVGHGLIKPQMRREGAVFAGELSNHFYFRDFYGAESSDLVLLMLLDILSETGRSLSELVDPLMRYSHSGEINYEVEDKGAALTRLKERYGRSASLISEIDGIRMEFRDASLPRRDWWFNVRASNTEPLLRLNLEAKSREVMEEKKGEIEKLLL
jgi:phosphomannomutase